MATESSSEVEFYISMAKQFCSAIERANRDAVWRKCVYESLVRLYSAAATMPLISSSDCDVGSNEFRMSVDEWQRIHDHISERLGADDGYWQISDPLLPVSVDQEAIFGGSLSDDLADVYRDVSRCIRASESSSKQVALEVIGKNQRVDFPSHWGLHAISAIRILHSLVLEPGSKRDDNLSDYE
jgi:hypothetical protein